VETLAEQRRGRAGRLRYGNGEYVKACQERIKQKSSENHPNKMIFGTFGPSVEIRTQGLLNPIQRKTIENKGFFHVLRAIGMQ